MCPFSQPGYVLNLPVRVDQAYDEVGNLLYAIMVLTKGITTYHEAFGFFGIPFCYWFLGWLFFMTDLGCAALRLPGLWIRNNSVDSKKRKRTAEATKAAKATKAAEVKASTEASGPSPDTSFYQSFKKLVEEDEEYEEGDLSQCRFCDPNIR